MLRNPLNILLLLSCFLMVCLLDKNVHARTLGENKADLTPEPLVEREKRSYWGDDDDGEDEQSDLQDVENPFPFDDSADEWGDGNGDEDDWGNNNDDDDDDDWGNINWNNGDEDDWGNNNDNDDDWANTWDDEDEDEWDGDDWGWEDESGEDGWTDEDQSEADSLADGSDDSFDLFRNLFDWDDEEDFQDDQDGTYQ